MKELPHKAPPLRLSVARRVYRLSGGSSFKSCLSCGPKGRLVTKIRSLRRGSVLLGGLRRSFVTSRETAMTMEYTSSDVLKECWRFSSTGRIRDTICPALLLSRYRTDLVYCV